MLNEGLEKINSMKRYKFVSEKGRDIYVEEVVAINSQKNIDTSSRQNLYFNVSFLHIKMMYYVKLITAIIPPLLLSWILKNIDNWQMPEHCNQFHDLLFIKTEHLTAQMTNVRFSIVINIINILTDIVFAFTFYDVINGDKCLDFFCIAGIIMALRCISLMVVRIKQDNLLPKMHSSILKHSSDQILSIPMISNGFGAQSATDFFFSGHLAFITLCIMHWLYSGNYLIVYLFSCFGLIVSACMILTRFHNYMDLYAGIMTSISVYSLYNLSIK